MYLQFEETGLINKAAEHENEQDDRMWETVKQTYADIKKEIARFQPSTIS